MRSENRLVVIVFLVLLSLLAIPLAVTWFADRRRPQLEEIRVVSSTAADPVCREGARELGPEDEVTLSVAVRTSRRWGPTTWFSPCAQLELSGVTQPHRLVTEWPESDRELRVFWFALESPLVGGTQSDDLAREFALQPFLAPEMGQGWVAVREPEIHSTAGLSPLEGVQPVAAGTYRIYVRGELSRPGEVRTLQSATSLGPEHADSERMCRISRTLDPSWGLEKAAGRLFRLPSFEPAADSVPRRDMMASMAARLEAISSRVFAESALGDRFPSTPDGGARVEFADGIVRRAGRPVPFDPTPPSRLLRAGHHWLIPLRDDGDGFLGGGDLVAQSWRRPASILPLASALAPEERGLLLLQAGPKPGSP